MLSTSADTFCFFVDSFSVDGIAYFKFPILFRAFCSLSLLMQDLSLFYQRSSSFRPSHPRLILLRVSPSSLSPPPPEHAWHSLISDHQGLFSKHSTKYEEVFNFNINS